MTEWDGKPARAGWHWLERRKDGALRRAYWHPKRLHWWVAVEEGRTQPMSDLRVKQTYIYRAFVEPPPASKRSEKPRSRATAANTAKALAVPSASPFSK
jgi:hypothetical protein